MANQAKTINQKGDLMSYRPDIKLLDATIRDGGLVNNFGFSDEFVKELYKTNIKSGVEYMEFGYKASKELFDVKEFGKWKFCDEEDIRAIVGENDSPLKLSVMADVARVSRAMQKAFQPEKINYGAYSDKLSHLHFHLAPKYVDGPDYGGTFQMNPGKVYLTDAEYQELIDAVKANL